MGDGPSSTVPVELRDGTDRKDLCVSGLVRAGKGRVMDL